MPRTPLKWLIFAILLLGFTEIGTGFANQVDHFDLPYGADPLQRLDLCLAHGPSPTPAIILVHGGGWSGGRKEDFRLLCRMFADSGITAIAIDYRLADGTPRGAWPAQLSDVALSARWLSNNAGRFGVDASQTCIFGNSAGGQIALMAGSEFGEFKPKCIVDNWGPVDLSYPPPLRSALRKLFPGTDDATQLGAAASMSPLAMIGPNFPPVFVAQGIQDKLVPPDQSQRLVEKLRTNNVPYQFVEFYGGHEMVGLSAVEKKAIIDLEIAFVRRMTVH